MTEVSVETSYKLKSFVLFFEVLTCLIISRSIVICVSMNLLVRATCEVEKMSHVSITSLGGGESLLHLLPLLFRFFFTRELNKSKNGDTEVFYFKCFLSLERKKYSISQHSPLTLIVVKIWEN